MYQYILFDLDGTLTDPKEGICKSVQFALHEMNIEEPDLDQLEKFIGPPLKQSFQEFYGLDEEKAEFGVKKYRERYAPIGIFENEIYPGMKTMLKMLHEKGVHMAVASSKPKLFVEKIMKYFEIEQYFEVITGSDLQGGKAEKIDVMREALAKLFSLDEEKIVDLSEDENADYDAQLKKAKRMIPVDQILMVGDRKFDVLGAKHFFISSAGVSFGYAEDGELKEAGADYITDDLNQLYEIITGEKTNRPGLALQNEEVIARFQKPLLKSYYILMPLVYSFFMTTVLKLFFVNTRLMERIMHLFFQGNAEIMAQNSNQISVYLDAFITVVCAVVFAVMYSKEKRRAISVVVERRINQNLERNLFFIALFGGCLSLALNLLFDFAKIIRTSESFNEVASVQYSVPLLAGIIIYGFIKPISEELLMRGLIYGRMRAFFSAGLCIPLSALIFGAWHGNLVQLIFGFMMGCVLAYIYEKYRNITASIILHASANIFVYLVAMIPVLNKFVYQIWVVGILVICTGITGIIVLKNNELVVK